MSGICGIFNAEKLLKEKASLICAGMARAMTYRGPDEEGFYQNDKITFGHRGLGSIDVSSGRQPMHDSEQDLTIVFDGAISNFTELRSELTDYNFKTKSDTEVILAGYQKWGRQVVDKLKGAFAFVIYDRKQNLIFAARDHIGKKPFYYYITKKGTFYFASDLQSLAASGMLPGNISQKAIRYYFTLGYIPSPLSIYEGVYKLEAGHALQYNSDGLKTWQFWDINFNIQNNLSEMDFEEKLEELLVNAVKNCINSDVPIGALLSGGIDSNLVTAVTARHSPGTIKTFTAGFDETTTATGTRDERHIAETAARYYGLSHQSVSVSDNNDDFILPKLIPYLGEPLADNSIIPTFLVCKAVREHLKCALTGDGGDEPFGGYSFRYLPHLGEERIRKFIPKPILFPIAAIMEKIWPASESLPRLLRLNTVFRNLSIPGEKAFLLDQAIRIPANQPLLPEILAGREEVLQMVKDLYAKGKGRDELTRILYIDVKLYMIEDGLVKTDRMSMANSIELRAPLLDSEIVEFAFSLPGQMKIRGDRCKYILKKLAMKYVCPQILNIPKTGFSVPAENYLRGVWRSDFESRVFHPGSPVAEFMNIAQLNSVWHKFLKGSDVSSKLFWATYILSLWFNEFHQRQSFYSGDED